VNAKPAFSPIEKLAASHKVETFDCGSSALNSYLQRYALLNQNNNAAQTYVTGKGKTVMGFYTLTVGSVSHEHATERVQKGLAKHPVPVMILARLAVEHRARGQGFGKALLKDALLRTVEASEIAGIRALLVHAKDDDAKSWYQQFDFEVSRTDTYHLFLLMKDLKALLR
jgi:GNAT superfamily N-acetyltransferase